MLRNWLIYIVVIGVAVLAVTVHPTFAQAQNTSNTTPQTFKGTITELVSEQTNSYSDGTSTRQQVFKIKLDQGETVDVTIEKLSQDTALEYKVGDRVIVGRDPFAFESTQGYYIADYIRTPALGIVLAFFMVLVVAVAGWHGVRSFVGLASSFLIIFAFILPFIERGYNPILVAVGGAVFIMLITFYLSHGFHQKTTIAVAGTFLSLVTTAILAMAFITLAKLTGFASEETVFLQVTQGAAFNAKGLLLAGIIIGTLGVLDDITLSQASVVQELVQTNPKLKAKELFLKAMNVGKDHIASLVNTLVLVYTGSALPLLLLFQNAQTSPLNLLNYEIIAEEVVKTLVGSCGLILAVPLTTLLAVYRRHHLMSAPAVKHSHKR